MKLTHPLKKKRFGIIAAVFTLLTGAGIMAGQTAFADTFTGSPGRPGCWKHMFDWQGGSRFYGQSFVEFCGVNGAITENHRVYCGFRGTDMSCAKSTAGTVGDRQFSVTAVWFVCKPGAALSGGGCRDGRVIGTAYQTFTYEWTGGYWKNGGTQDNYFEDGTHLS